MEKEILETVLTEMMEEQKISNQLNRELIDQVKGLQEKVAGFGQKLEKLQVIAPPADTRAVQKVVADGLTVIATMIEAQPKNVINQKRLLLFPETNMGQYYRIVFGRLIPWGLLFTGICFLFSIIGREIDRSAEADIRKYYYEQYSNAWYELDSVMDKSGRQKMHAAWKRAVKN